MLDGMAAMGHGAKATLLWAAWLPGPHQVQPHVDAESPHHLREYREYAEPCGTPMRRRCRAPICATSQPV